MFERTYLNTILATIACISVTAVAATAQQTSPDADMSDLYNHSTTATSQQPNAQAGSGAESTRGGIATAPETNAKSNAAVNTKRQESRTAAAPVAGRNSFTEGEARRRIESFGYFNVSNLKKDDQGIWRGSAMRNGQTTDIALDYQGNIVGNQP